MEAGHGDLRILSMEALSNSKVAWLVTLLCAVSVCHAATDAAAASAAPRRADQGAHPSGQTRKLLSNLGTATVENSFGRSDERKLNAPVFRAPESAAPPQSEPDAVHAALANLSWQSRAKMLEETGRRFHQEGLPLTHLWQSSSSSLSIGINPDRKPGLWFVKRFP